jgi:COP9 signalosome complex subunit 7
LEPILLLAKAAKGAGAAKLIEEATAAQGVFTFAELLDMPNLKEVSPNSQHCATV